MLTSTVERNGVADMLRKISMTLAILLGAAAILSVGVAFAPATAQGPQIGGAALNTPYESALSDVAVASGPSANASSCKGCKVCVNIGDSFCAPTTVPSHCHKSHPLEIGRASCRERV